MTKLHPEDIGLLSESRSRKTPCMTWLVYGLGLICLGAVAFLVFCHLTGQVPGL